MFKFITSKPLWVNILVGVLSLAVVVILFFVSLGVITGHGKYEKVPSILGQNVYAAINTLESKGFKVEVSDSVFDASIPKAVIIKQIPEGDALVKSGRTIYLTINRSVPPLVEMPSLIGFSFKSACIYLKSMGLVLGDTTYKQDFAKNAVLEQLLKNEPIKPGAQVPVGSAISFVLGTGVGDSLMNVPDVVGLTFMQAKTRLSLNKLSTGTVIVDGQINDTANAYVVRQNPAIYIEQAGGERAINKIKSGTLIDLYISNTPPIKDSTNTYPQ